MKKSSIYKIFFITLTLLVVLSSCTTTQKRERKIFSKDVIENEGIYWLTIGDKVEMLISILGAPNYVFHNEFYLKNVSKKDGEKEIKEELFKRFIDKYLIEEKNIFPISTLGFASLYRDDENFIIFDEPFFRSALAFYDLGLFVFLDSNERIMRVIALTDNFNLVNPSLIKEAFPIADRIITNVGIYRGEFLIGGFSTDDSFQFAQEKYLSKKTKETKKAKNSFTISIFERENVIDLDNEKDQKEYSSLIFLSSKTNSTYIDFYNDKIRLISIGKQNIVEKDFETFRKYIDREYNNSR